MAWNILELQRNKWRGLKTRIDVKVGETTIHSSPDETGSGQRSSSLEMQRLSLWRIKVREGEETGRAGDGRIRRRDVITVERFSKKKKSWERFVSGLVLEVTQERWNKEHDYKWFNNLSQVAFQISFLIAEEGAGTKRRCRRSDGDWKRQQSGP